MRRNLFENVLNSSLLEFFINAFKGNFIKRTNLNIATSNKKVPLSLNFNANCMYSCLFLSLENSSSVQRFLLRILWDDLSFLDFQKQKAPFETRENVIRINDQAYWFFFSFICRGEEGSPLADSSFVTRLFCYCLENWWFKEREYEDWIIRF